MRAFFCLQSTVSCSVEARRSCTGGFLPSKSLNLVMVNKSTRLPGWDNRSDEKKFIHSFPKYFWSICSVAGIILGIWNSSLNKADNKCIELILLHIRRWYMLPETNRAGWGESEHLLLDFFYLPDVLQMLLIIKITQSWKNEKIWTPRN